MYYMYVLSFPQSPSLFPSLSISTLSYCIPLLLLCCSLLTPPILSLLRSLLLHPPFHLYTLFLFSTLPTSAPLCPPFSLPPSSPPPRNSVPNTGFYPNDPLWDGDGCTASSAYCNCSFNNPPYFTKQLPSILATFYT